MIDISSVETMWLLPIWQQGQEIHAIQQDLKDFLRYYYQNNDCPANRKLSDCSLR